MSGGRTAHLSTFPALLAHFTSARRRTKSCRVRLAKWTISIFLNRRQKNIKITKIYLTVEVLLKQQITIVTAKYYKKKNTFLSSADSPFHVGFTWKSEIRIRNISFRIHDTKKNYIRQNLLSSNRNKWKIQEREQTACVCLWAVSFPSKQSNVWSCW